MSNRQRPSDSEFVFPSFRLDGRVALVTGGSRGLGLGIALALNCPIAATVGGVVPLAARACRVDPAVLSTPFITTFHRSSGVATPPG